MQRVYVADDDPVLLNLMRINVGSMPGVEGAFFDNGLDLYRQVQQAPPDAVVSDIILPRLEGLVVARLIKFDEKYRHVRVMIISSITDNDIAEQVKRVGADDFLAKPFRPHVFRERVKNLLDRAEG